MTSEWIAQLAPLLLLLIVTLLVFVGCTLNREGKGPLMTLRYPENMHLDVISIQVKFEVFGGGGSASEERTLLNSGIKPLGGTIESTMLLGGDGEIGPTIEESDEADLECKCTVTRIGDVWGSPEVTHHKEEDEMPVDFVLSRSGNEFSLA